jgi:hypothetical protein
LIDGPLEGCDNRNSEIAEQAGKVLCIRFDLGTKTLVRLQQEELLDVDYHTAAITGDNAFNHRHVVVACP